MLETTCTCEICENLELLLTAIEYPNLQKDGAKLMQHDLCDPSNEACVNETCGNCGDGNIFYEELMTAVKSKNEQGYYQ